MKVQTKITLLIVLVVAIFMAGLWGFRAFDKSELSAYRGRTRQERSQAFDAFLEKDGEPLKTFAEDDSLLGPDGAGRLRTRMVQWFKEK